MDKFVGESEGDPVQSDELEQTFGVRVSFGFPVLRKMFELEGQPEIAGVDEKNGGLSAVAQLLDVLGPSSWKQCIVPQPVYVK